MSDVFTIITAILKDGAHLWSRIQLVEASFADSSGQWREKLPKQDVFQTKMGISGI